MASDQSLLTHSSALIPRMTAEETLVPDRTQASSSLRPMQHLSLIGEHDYRLARSVALVDCPVKIECRSYPHVYAMRTEWFYDRAFE